MRKFFCAALVLVALPALAVAQTTPPAKPSVPFTPTTGNPFAPPGSTMVDLGNGITMWSIGGSCKLLTTFSFNTGSTSGTITGATIASVCN